MALINEIECSFIGNFYMYNLYLCYISMNNCAHSSHFLSPQITVHVCVMYVTKDSRQKETLTNTRREFTWELLNMCASSVTGPFVMWVFIMLGTPLWFFFSFWDALYMSLFLRTPLMVYDFKERRSRYCYCTLSLMGFKIYLLVSMYNSSLY